MYVRINANPSGKQVGDCVVRAVSAALGIDWYDTYVGIALEGFILCDMPSANHVWGAYLRRRGFVRRALPESCPDCYTVADFCRDHPRGTYILAIDGHVVCARDGDYFDSWDSGNEIPIYYWERKEQ